MSDKVHAIGNEKVKKNKIQEFQERFAQYSANFQAPNKTNSIFTVDAPTESRVTGLHG